MLQPVALPAERGLVARCRFYRRVLGYFRADLPRIVLLLALIGGGTVLGLLQVWPVAILVDTVLSPGLAAGNAGAPALPAAKLTQIILLAVITLLLRLASELVGMVRGMLHLKIGNAGMMRVRCDLFGKLQALHLLYHRSQSQGDTIYRLTNDTTGCQTILNTLVDTGIAVVTLVVMLAILASQSVELTLISLAVIPPLALTNIAFGRTLKARSVQAKQLESDYTALVQQSVASIGLVQAFGREGAELLRFRRSAKHSLGAWYSFHRQFAWYRLIVGAIFGGGAALIFGYGGHLVHRDQFLLANPDGMTIGRLLVFLTYLGMFYEPLCKLSGAAANILGGVVGMERVFDVLDRRPGVADAPDAIELPRAPRTLSLEQAGFEYRPGQPVLRDINVTIAPGRMVAFVGSSGVGKTTLLNLLPRFADPTEGSLKLDGIDVRSVRLRDLRRHVALVLQDSILLPTTVAENIAYGCPRATEADVHEAARLAGADRFIESLPDGYRTRVSEDGQNLSGGQRQRIAIARALLTEAPIIILDEPTSALDPHHEHVVADTLRRLKGQRTIILVSHRLGTVADCDEIHVLHDGRIVEQGTHEELLAAGGRYHDMARRQLPLDTPALHVA